MVLENILADGAAHFGAGITVSFLDYVTYRVANPKEKRIEEKKACLQSIEKILDAMKDSSQAPPETVDAQQTDDNAVTRVMQPNSLQYAQNITEVRDYLRKSGLVKFEIPFFRKIKDGFRNLIYQERINNLSNTGKLGAAIGLEVLYDTLFGFRYYTTVLQKSPIAAIATNIYQIPVFFLGMLAGNGMKKGVDWCLTSGDERKMNKAINALLKETRIIDLVVKYEPPEQVREQMDLSGIKIYGSKLTGAGNKLYKKFQRVAGTIVEGTTDAVDHVAHYGDRKRAQAEEEKQGRIDEFDKLTKDR